MSSYTLLRVVALLGTLAVYAALEETAARLSVVYAIAFGHYLLGAVWSFGAMRDIAGDRLRRWPFAALLLGGGALYSAGLPVQSYFGIHHALNESYMLDRVTRARSTAIDHLRWSSVGLHAILYAALIRDSPAGDLLSIDPRLGWTALAAAYLVWGWQLSLAQPQLDRREVADNLAGEVLGAVVLAASFAVPISAVQIALYHFLFWVLFPLRGMARAGGGAVLRYGLATVGVTLSCLAFSPLAGHALSLDLPAFHRLFVWGTFAHITLSFAVSSANPAWLRARFTGAP